MSVTKDMHPYLDLLQRLRRFRVLLAQYVAHVDRSSGFQSDFSLYRVSDLRHIHDDKEVERTLELESLASLDLSPPLAAGFLSAGVFFAITVHYLRNKFKRGETAKWELKDKAPSKSSECGCR